MFTFAPEENATVLLEDKATKKYLNFLWAKRKKPLIAL